MVTVLVVLETGDSLRDRAFPLPRPASLLFSEGRSERREAFFGAVSPLHGSVVETSAPPRLACKYKENETNLL